MGDNSPLAINPFDKNEKTQPIKNDGEFCRFCHRKTKPLKLFNSETKYCPDCETSSKKSNDPYGFTMKDPKDFSKLPSWLDPSQTPGNKKGPQIDIDQMTLDDWIKSIDDDTDPFLRIFIANIKHFKENTAIKTIFSWTKYDYQKLVDESTKLQSEVMCDIHEATYCVCKQQQNNNKEK